MTTSQKQIVGKYEMGKILAVGQFDSRTRLCTHIVTGAQYVVRVYNKSVLAEAQWMWDRTRDAIHVMRTLPKHENIIEIIECFETQSSLYILMQLFSPMHLTRLYTSETESGNRISIPIDKTKHYYYQIVYGLLHLHNNGVVHLGLAPDHVMVNNRDQVKIGFLASCMRFPKGKLSSEMRGTTRTVAPEVLHNQPYDPYIAEAWSMGVLLYFMLHQGRYPHDGANTIKNIKYQRIRPIDPNLPQDARDLLSRLLHPNPSQRMRVEQIVHHPFFAEGRGRAGVADVSTGENVDSQSDRGFSVSPAEYAVDASTSCSLDREKEDPSVSQNGHETNWHTENLKPNTFRSMAHDSDASISPLAVQDESSGAKIKFRLHSSSADEDGDSLQRRQRRSTRQRQLSRASGAMTTPTVGMMTSAVFDAAQFDDTNVEFISMNEVQKDLVTFGVPESTVMDFGQTSSSPATRRSLLSEKQARFEKRHLKNVPTGGTSSGTSTSGGGGRRGGGEATISEENEQSIVPSPVIYPDRNACTDAECAALASNITIDPLLPCPVCKRYPRQRLGGRKPYGKTSFVYKNGEYSLKVEE